MRQHYIILDGYIRSGEVEAAQKYVDAYDGLLEIQSSGREFYVAVTLFYKE